MSISPFFSLSKMSSFFFLLIPDINNSHLILNWFSIFSKFTICCVARIAVGARIAAWYPDFTALYAAIIDTTVFPEPTSPCNNLFIDFWLSISLSISSKTFNWAFVNLNGNSFITSDILIFLLYSIPFCSFFQLLFKFNRASCIIKSSSNTNLLRASLKSSKVCGLWIFWIDVFKSNKLYCFNMYSGMLSSSSLSICDNAFSIIFLKVFWGRLNVVG